MTRPRLLRSGHLRVHRRPAATPFAPLAKRFVADRQPAVGERSPCCGRRSCRAWWTLSRTTGAASSATCGCSRSARASREQRRDAALALRLDGRRAGRALERQRTRDVGLLRREGRRASSLRRRLASPSNRWRRPAVLVAGQAAGVCAGRRRVDGARDRASSAVAPAVGEQHGLPRQDAVFVAEVDLDRAARPRRRQRLDASSRCRASRRSSRDISILVDETLACGRPFVARFAAAMRRARWSASRVRSLPGQGRSRRTRSASRCG